MTPRRRSAALSALSAAIALLVPAALAQAVPVMTTSTSGSMFTIDITGAGANKAVWFLGLPAGIDRSVLANVFDTTAAGAQLIHTGRTDATGSFHISFAVTAVPQDAEYAAYTPWAGIRFLGTMVPNPSASSVLEPGVGFLGPTTEPGQIGTGTAKAIARWDVVPYQTIVEATTPTFKVGVVAFHIAGIAKVSFSLEGGPWVDARSMTLNPQTGVVEYCATIDASDFASDRPIELRAIAYPKAAAPQAAGTGGYPGGGFPRLLESMWLYVDADAAQVPNVAYCSPGGHDGNPGTQSSPVRTLWRAAQIVNQAGGGSADGGIVYMDAGDYDWASTLGDPCANGTWGWSIPQTAHRWLTFRPRPGVTRDQVRITWGQCYGMLIDRARLHDITVNDRIDGNPHSDSAVWLDRVTCQGDGQGSSANWLWTGGYKRRYYTETTLSDHRFSIGHTDLARNVTARRIRQFGAADKLVVNCTVEDIGAGGTDDHPDLLSWNYSNNAFDNHIVYGLTATQTSAYMIIKDNPGVSNLALVNVALKGETAAATVVGENVGLIDHLLVFNCTWRQSWVWQLPQANMRNISVRGNWFETMGINTGGNGVNNAWFDQNGIGQGWSPFAPGTNTTTSDPQFIGPFTPGPSSPLRLRLNPLLVPMDKDGVTRVAPATVGAVE